MFNVNNAEQLQLLLSIHEKMIKRLKNTRAETADKLQKIQKGKKLTSTYQSERR